MRSQISYQVNMFNKLHKTSSNPRICIRPIRHLHTQPSTVRYVVLARPALLPSFPLSFWVIADMWYFIIVSFFFSFFFLVLDPVYWTSPFLLSPLLTPTVGLVKIRPRRIRAVCSPFAHWMTWLVVEPTQPTKLAIALGTTLQCVSRPTVRQWIRLIFNTSEIYSSIHSTLVIP